MSQRVQFFEYNGKRILGANFPSIRDKDEFVRAVRDVDASIVSQPRASVLVYVNFTDAVISKEANEQMKVSAARVGPYLKGVAAIGVDGLKRVILTTAVILSRKNVHFCSTREQALDWLVTQ